MLVWVAPSALDTICERPFPSAALWRMLTGSVYLLLCLAPWAYQNLGRGPCGYIRVGQLVTCNFLGFLVCCFGVEIIWAPGLHGIWEEKGSPWKGVRCPLGKNELGWGLAG